MGGKQAEIGWKRAGPGLRLEAGRTGLAAGGRQEPCTPALWPEMGGRLEMGRTGHGREWAPVGCNTGTWDGRWAHGHSSGMCRNGAAENGLIRAGPGLQLEAGGNGWETGRNRLETGGNSLETGGTRLAAGSRQGLCMLALQPEMGGRLEMGGNGCLWAVSTRTWDGRWGHQVLT